MPNREKAVEAMISWRLGEHAWMANTHPATHACDNAPECGLPRDSKEAAAVLSDEEKAMDDALVVAVDAIDWQRVLGIAMTRHMVMREKYGEAHKHGPFGIDGQVEAVCGECIGEAVLQPQYAQFGWPDDQEKSPRFQEREVFER